MTSSSALFAVYALAFWLLPVVSVFAVNIYGVVPMILGLAACICAWRKKTLWIDFDRALAIWLGALVILSISSILWAAFPGAGMEKSWKIVLVYFFGFWVFILAGRIPFAQAVRLEKGIVAALALSLFLCTLELTFGHPLYRLLKDADPGDAPVKSLVNHGLVVLSVTSWGLLHILLKKKKAMAAAGVWAALLGVALFLSQSETAAGALIIGGGVFIAALLFPRFCFAFLVVALPAGILLSPWLAQAVFGAFRMAEPDAAWRVFGMRFEIWDAVARYALHSPIYGHGIEAAREITDFGFENIQYQRGRILHPHNNILQVWLELGAIGAGFLCGFAVFMLVRLKRLDGIRYASAMGCLAACLTVGTVGYGLWQTWWPGLLFTTAAMMRVVLRESEAPPPA